MRTIRRLLGFLREPWRLVLLAVSLGWATTVSWVALISTSAYLISYAALHPSVAELQVAIVGVRFFGIARAVFRYLERLVSHTVTFRLLARMRTWLYEKIEPLVPAGLGDQKSSDLYSRLAGDIETLQDFYVRVVAPPLVAILSSTAVLWFFSHWSVGIAMLLLGFQILTGVVTPLVVRKLGMASSRAIGNGRSGLANLIVDGIQGSADIQAFGLRGEYWDGFQNRLHEIETAERKQNYIQGSHAALVGLGVNLSAFLVLVMAIPMVDQGTLDGRLLAVVVLGALASYEAITPLPLAFQNLEESVQVGERLFDLADRPVVVAETGEKVVDLISPHLEIKNLAFAYSPNETKVLSDFTLDLPPGKKVAVVGPSGAGKTTILNLLMRFWPISEGEITLNGENIQEYQQEEVRQLFSYVPQTPFIFNASIRENIRIGDPNASDEKVEVALGRAGLMEFVSSLPQGASTLAGEYGVMLSGGQRQRVAIARALVRNAPIYLLDEPAENLDPVTADYVLESFLDEISDRSILMITHRLVGLEKMDEILVMQGHQFVERGSYAELISQNGNFARMIAESRAEI